MKVISINEFVRFFIVFALSDGFQSLIVCALLVLVKYLICSKREIPSLRHQFVCREAGREDSVLCVREERSGGYMYGVAKSQERFTDC
jgi:hypothetical protein